MDGFRVVINIGAMSDITYLLFWSDGIVESFFNSWNTAFDLKYAV